MQMLRFAGRMVNFAGFVMVFVSIRELFVKAADDDAPVPICDCHKNCRGGQLVYLCGAFHNFGCVLELL